MSTKRGAATARAVMRLVDRYESAGRQIVYAANSGDRERQAFNARVRDILRAEIASRLRRMERREP